MLFTVGAIVTVLALVYYGTKTTVWGARQTKRKASELKDRWGSRAHELEREEPGTKDSGVEMTARVGLTSGDTVEADPPESDEPQNYAERCEEHEQGWRVVEDGEVVEDCSFCQGRGSNATPVQSGR